MPTIPARNICLIRLSALGDTIHALALANGLRRGYPDARITWILEPLPYDIVRLQPAVDRFIVFNARGGLKQWTHLRRELAGERFDLAVVAQPSSKAALVTALVPAEIKLGFDKGRSRELHSLVINRRIDPQPVRHAQDQSLEFLEYLGITGPPEWNLTFSREEEDEAQRFFDTLERPALAMVIATAHPEKDWPAAFYSAVADHASSSLGLQPLLVGGPSAKERAIAEEIVRGCVSSSPVVALDRPIRQMLLKLRGSAIVISPDTGPLHAAVAMNRPTIGLYGYSDSRRCGPYRRFSELVIDRYNDPDVSPLPISRRTRKGRMGLISPADVIEKIDVAMRTYGVSYTSRNLRLVRHIDSKHTAHE